MEYPVYLFIVVRLRTPSYCNLFFIFDYKYLRAKQLNTLPVENLRILCGSGLGVVYFAY